MADKPDSYRALRVAVLAGQLMFVASTAVDAARLLYENTFANGFADARQAGTPYVQANCERTYWPDFNDPTGGNNPALHAFVPGDKACATGEANQGPKHRAEVVAAPSGKLLVFQENRYYFVGYRLWIPSSRKNAFGSGQISHMSFPDKDTALYIQGSNGNPNIAVLRRQAHDTKERWKFAIQYDTWNDIVLMNRPAKDNTGEIALWVNGEQKLHRTGVPTMGNNTNGHTKAGIYWATETRPHDYELYIDDWRIAEGADAYDLVDPAGGRAGGRVVEPQVPPVPTGLNLSINE